MLRPGKLLAMPVAAPIGGLTWLAQKIAEAAVTEWLDPARIERRLLQLEQRLEAGEIDEATYEQAEAGLLEELRLIRASLAEDGGT
jgi:Gas vesicle protein G